MLTKFILFVIIIFAVGFGGYLVYRANQIPKPVPTLGPTSLSPMLSPIPPTQVDITGEIQKLLAQKYNKQLSEVKVTVDKQTGAYAGGSVLFGAGGPGEGGMFLAYKKDKAWQLAFDGNGNVDCAKMRTEFGFTDEILKPNFCN